jgi:hypothetical protein
MENAWATGRCRLRWITPPLNTVWRIKADAEQNTFISTSRRFRGLSVVDRDTSEPLFGIRGLEPYSHIEAGRGFVVFNTPGQVGPLAGVLHDDDNGG